jgi:hypothetical protein
MVTGNHYTAFSCGGVYGKVLGPDSLLFRRSTELSGKVVFAHAANIDGGIRRKDVTIIRMMCVSGGALERLGLSLCGSACDVVHWVVFYRSSYKDSVLAPQGLHHLPLGRIFLRCGVRSEYVL